MAGEQTGLRIALVGYGAMGRLLEELAPEYACRVTAVFDEQHSLAQRIDAADFDVAIDFSLPDAVMDNARALCAAGRAMVIGTTGWNAHRAELRAMVEQAGTGCLVGSNFSVGMQMFFRIVRRAAELAGRYEDYDLMLHELHHRRKADSPSGTAYTLAEILRESVERKQHVQVETVHGVIDPAALHVSSTRGGYIPGTHTVFIDSAADTLELTHRARNKRGFAAGALRAAHWIHGKKGFYDFSDIFEEL